MGSDSLQRNKVNAVSVYILWLEEVESIWRVCLFAKSPKFSYTLHILAGSVDTENDNVDVDVKDRLSLRTRCKSVRHQSSRGVGCGNMQQWW